MRLCDLNCRSHSPAHCSNGLESFAGVASLWSRCAASFSYCLVFSCSWARRVGNRLRGWILGWSIVFEALSRLNRAWWPSDERKWSSDSGPPSAVGPAGRRALGEGVWGASCSSAPRPWLRVPCWRPFRFPLGSETAVTFLRRPGCFVDCGRRGLPSTGKRDKGFWLQKFCWKNFYAETPDSPLKSRLKSSCYVNSFRKRVEYVYLFGSFILIIADGTFSEEILENILRQIICYFCVLCFFFFQCYENIETESVRYREFFHCTYWKKCLYLGALYISLWQIQKKCKTQKL